MKYHGDKLAVKYMLEGFVYGILVGIGLMLLF